MTFAKWGLILLLVLPGCAFRAANLSPETIAAYGELAKIDKVSFCGRVGLEGNGGFVAGEAGMFICGGTKEPLTINEAIQGMNGISITVTP